ncbi:MAG: YajQ family cyclic di-GMP-binding protein [Nitrospirota bacterium]|nr:YajQ family cyclic di-GMP-binding protein [Nitrospirota bacterium]
MASDSSFDIVSELNLPEVTNAVDQAMKEITQRFDFKGSVSKITLENDKLLVLHSDDKGKLESVVRVLEERLVKRGVSLKSLEYGKVEPATGATVRQTVALKQGIPADKAKKIVKAIKDMKIKVQAAVQGEQVRVSGKKRDDLQAVMQHLKEQDFDLPLQFNNFR